MIRVVELLADMPGWVRRPAGAVVGALVGAGVWHGRWWGLASLAVMFALVFLALAVAEEATK